MNKQINKFKKPEDVCLQKKKPLTEHSTSLNSSNDVCLVSSWPFVQQEIRMLGCEKHVKAPQIFKTEKSKAKANHYNLESRELPPCQVSKAEHNLERKQQL